jgi:hypothetical protein
MSSTLLYLAIVAVWAGVLVPMWLRRDADAPGFSRRLLRRSGTLEELPEDLTAEDQTVEEDSRPYDDEIVTAEKTTRRRNSRAAVIARRRRRTSGLLLLVVAVTGVVISGLAPWWAVLPPVSLLAGHLSLLRVAAGIDQGRRREAALARLEARALEREKTLAAEAAQEAEEAGQAEVIDLVARNRVGEVFDQYIDQLRAVGD